MSVCLLCVYVCVCVTATRGEWQDSAELSKEPPNLICPAGSQHLFCSFDGNHLLPDTFNTARGFTEQVRHQ